MKNRVVRFIVVVLTSTLVFTLFGCSSHNKNDNSCASVADCVINGREFYFISDEARKEWKGPLAKLLSLRKTLFQVMSVILQNSPEDEPVYTYLDKKRSEGNPTEFIGLLLQTNFCASITQELKNALSTLEVATRVYKKFGIAIQNFLYVDNVTSV